MWNFIVDREWQYLRNMADAGLLKFEEQDNGMYEFVVLPAWPHMVRNFFMISYDEKLKLCRSKQIVQTAPSLRPIYSFHIDY